MNVNKKPNNSSFDVNFQIADGFSDINFHVADTSVNLPRKRKMSVVLVYKMVVVASRRIVLGLLLVVLSQAVVASGQQGNLQKMA